MNVREHIDRLEYLIVHGMNEESELQAWCPESEDWQPVAGIVYSSNAAEPVRLYTDDMG